MRTHRELAGLTWRKSSHSQGTGQCVEIAYTWRKSSHSQGGAECVEIARTATVTAVRDSKNASGPALLFPEYAFRDFLGSFR